MARIPKYYHFVFGLKPQTEPFHLMYYLCLASCMGVNKPDKVFFYYRHEPFGVYWDMIKPYLTLERVELNDFVNSFRYPDECGAAYSYAHHTDFIRLEKLIERGGVYADLDTIFVNPLPDHFYAKEFIMGEELGMVVNGEYHGSLCNAWLMSVPGARFATIWLDQMKRQFDGSWSGHCTFLPYRLSKTYPDLIHVEPQRSFFKHPWTKKGIRKLFVQDDADLAGVYSFHLWSHLWWEKERLDFSTFHKDLLTEEYIRFARSTYARVARNYLPENSSLTKAQYLKQTLRSRVENIFLFSRYASKKIWNRLKPKHMAEHHDTL